MDELTKAELDYFYELFQAGKSLSPDILNLTHEDSRYLFQVAQRAVLANLSAESECSSVSLPLEHSE
jgi:hypothetical protein